MSIPPRTRQKIRRARTGEIVITDATGRIVYKKYRLLENTLDVSFLSTGIYMLTLNVDNCIASQKFMKQ